MGDPEPVPPAGELLKHYRLRAGLTQEELAERAGLSARGIRALEASAQRAPRKDTLNLLAAALGLSPAERSVLERAVHERRASDRSRPRIRRAWLGPRTPLIGRAAERALFDQLLAGATPPLLLLAGEPGIGKSRLLEDAATRAEEQGWTVLAGGCTHRSAQDAYAPCVEALARFLATRGSKQMRMDLHGCSWLARLLPELAEIAPSPSASWALPPQQERRLMFAAVTRFLDNIAGPAGALLLLDDLHWAGADALDLLSELARQASGRRLRIAGAYRETDVQPGDPLPLLLTDLVRDGLATQALLHPLNPHDSETLLGALLTQAGEDADVVRRGIVARAGGVPFYLVMCAQEAQCGVSEGSASRPSVPWSAHESIRMRVLRVGAAGLDALRVAAVAGGASSRQALTRVLAGLGYDESAQLRALDDTLHARLLIERVDGEYTFAHDLIHEAVEADITGARRAALHRRVAEAIEKEPMGRRRAAELAWHFAQGDERERALPYALLAGDEAETVYAHGEAERHFQSAYEWALELGDRPRIGEALEKRADVLYRLARFKEACLCLDDAIRLYREDNQWERLAWSTAQLARAGDPLGLVAASLARLQEFFAAAATATGSAPDVSNDGDEDPLARGAEAAAALLTPRAAARTYLCLTSRLLFLRRYEEVFGPSERAIAYARTAGDLRIESLAHAFRAEAHLMRGRIEEATVAVESARDQAAAAGDLEALFRSLFVRAKIHEARAEPARAREILLQNVQVVTELGDIGHLAGTLRDLATQCFALGDWTAATEHFSRAAALLAGEEADASNAPAAALRILAALRADYDWSFSTELAAIDDTFDHSLHVWSVALVSELNLLVGHADVPRMRLELAVGSDETLPGGYAHLLALLAWAQGEGGEPARAQETLGQARRLAAERRYRPATVDIERVDAALAMRTGDWERAKIALEKALALAVEAPYPYAEAKTRYDFGRLLVAIGEKDAARKHYQRARAICEELGERPYRAAIDRAFPR